MKRIAFLTQLLPAAFVALAASMGFQMSEPILEAVVFPEKPVVEEAVPLSFSRTETVEETEEKDEEPAAVGAFTDGVYQGTGTGYGGTTAVEVTVENAQIISVEVLSHHDTPSFFSRAKEPVIASILRCQTWEVDSVSGATYSSRGIKDGVKNALTGEKTATKTPEKPKPQKLKTEKFEEPETLRDGTFIGSAKGFGGTIKVSVTIKKGEITAIEVLSHDRETPSFFEKALAIIDRILEKQSPNVDTVSGATYSSNGIREAVKNALKKAAGTPSAEIDEPEGDMEEEEDMEEKEVIPEAPTEPIKPVVGIPADGTYPVSARVDTNSASKSYLCGQFDSYTLTGNVIFKDGKLTSIDALTVGDDATDWDYEDDVMYTTYAAETIVPALVEKQSGDVDSVSGATCSSKAIVQMYQTALGQAIDAYVEPAPEEPKQPENSEENKTPESPEFPETPEETEQPTEPVIPEEPAESSQEETIEEPTETEEQKETETVDESEQHEEPDSAEQPKKEESDPAEQPKKEEPE